MKLKNTLAIMTLITLISATFSVSQVFSPTPPIEPAPSASYERYGPRVNDIIFSVWGDVISESEALKAGLIDVMDWAAPAAYIEPPPSGADWWNDPAVTLGNYSEWGWYEYDLNCMQWPTGHGDMVPPGWTGSEPAVTTGHYWFNETCQRCLDARHFRKALAHLTNRAAMVNNMGGYAAAMDTFCFPGIISWENSAAQKYAYSIALAQAELAAGGFQDWDSDLTLEYSPGHDGVIVEELPTLMGWIRSDDPDRTYAGELLRDDLLGLLVPINFQIADRSTCYYHAWVAYDYHVYTGGWSWGRMPDMYFELWSSTKDTYPSNGADNYNRYHREDYDTVAMGLKAAITSTEAKTYSDACQVILHDDVACIPLYTFASFLAHRTNYGTHPGEAVYAGEKWASFCNELGYAFYSFWNPLNVHPETFMKGGTLRHGLLVDIEKWSPVHAEWFYDWLILQQIYESLIEYHPLDASKYVPLLADGMPEELTWELDGETCTRLRFKLVPGIVWHDLTPLTPEDVGWTFKYMKDQVSVANYWAVTNFEDYATAGNLTLPYADPVPPGCVDILYNVQSWLALDWAAGVPIIPKHIWEGKDAGSWNPEDHDAVIGTGPFMCNKDGVVGRPDHVNDEYAHLEANPYYYCKYVWPDVSTTPTNPTRDGKVLVSDWGAVAYPGRIFTYDTRLYPMLPPWPSAWVSDYDQHLDVDKNGAIDVDDLIEIGIVGFGVDWPPSHYEMVPPGP